MSKYEPASELCSPENTPQSWGPLGLQVPVLSPPLSPSKEFHREGILQHLHQLALPPGGPSTHGQAEIPHFTFSRNTYLERIFTNQIISALELIIYY